MSQAFAGPYLAAATLLVLAGLPKLRDPLPLVRGLRSAGMPAGRQAVRALAAVELLVGTAAVVAPSRWAAALVALSYAAFTAFVVLTLRRGGVLASCGCFGKADTPPTRTHLVVTSALSLTCASVALSPAPVGWQPTPLGPVVGLLAYAALLTSLLYLVLAVLPTVTAQSASRSAIADPGLQRG